MSSGVVFSRLSSLFNLLQTAPHKKKPILLLIFIMFKRLFGNPSSSSASSGRPSSSSSSKGGSGFSGSTTSGRAAFDAVDKLKDVSRVLGGFDFRSFVRSFVLSREKWCRLRCFAREDASRRCRRAQFHRDSEDLFFSFLASMQHH